MIGIRRVMHDHHESRTSKWRRDHLYVQPYGWMRYGPGGHVLSQNAYCSFQMMPSDAGYTTMQGISNDPSIRPVQRHYHDACGPSLPVPFIKFLTHMSYDSRQLGVMCRL